MPGRFQTVDAGQPFTVVVDYAHTDDALRNLTALAREFVGSVAADVITLFGCGGDRDRAKRPKMGRAAGEGSDFVVLTSDNPRSEDPEAIHGGCSAGAAGDGNEIRRWKPDRARAIRAGGGSRATGGHCPALPAKGTRKSRCCASGTIPFDDAEVAAAAIRELLGARA